MSLSPERWRQVKSVFDAALELDAASRPAWIDATCGPDTGLRDEVGSLLAALEVQPERFETGGAGSLTVPAGTSAPPPAIGARVGPYRLVREIGRGGMGLVFEAHREDDQYQKRVAVKTISGGADAALLLQRFRQERQILARLEHRNIAALYDGGVTPDGQPFFAMELVDGAPVTEYASREAMGVADRLRLFLQVCGAVHYAHQSLVIHRDLKPGNILVARDGTVKLLDFGIAKPVEAAGEGIEAGMTLADGGAPLTTAYASPEQVLGQPVTTATDLFSLGVVLYELLAGRHPFNHDRPGADEVRRRIREEDPAPPGSVAGGVLATLPRTARHDLDAMVLMALRKEPARRYPSVEALGEDLRRFLSGLPVNARPDALGYRARKFVRRNRAGVLGATAGVLALLAGMAAATWQARVAGTERDRARAAADKAERVNAFLQQTLGVADPSWYAGGSGTGPQATLAELVAEAGRRAEAELAGHPDALADVLRTVGRANQALRRTGMAIAQLERARALHLALAGPTSPDVAIDEHELGMAWNAAGDLRQAEDWMRRALASFRAAGDSLSDQYGRTLSDLGIVLSTSGRPAEAEPFVRAAAAHRWRFDSTSVANAIILGNLGLVLSQQGKLRDAEPVYRRALAAFDRYEREYFEEGYSLGNLAVDLVLLGRAEEAEGLAEQQVALFTRQLGPDHVAVGYGWVNLARARHARGALAEARAAGVRAERIFAAALPADHPDRARSDAILGMILGSEGRLAEAETRLRRALAVRRSRLAQGSPHIADVEMALGEVLLRAGRPAEAESLLVQAARSYQVALDPTDPRVAAAALRLAAVRPRAEGGG